MSTRIPVNTANSPVAGQLIGTLNALRDASDGLNALHAIGESAAANGDFETFNEVLAGVTGSSDPTLYNLLVAARAAVNVADLQTLLARVGQR